MKFNAEKLLMRLPKLTPLTKHEYKLISSLVYDKFGINLSEQKKSLIVGRLQKVLRGHGFDSFEKYYNYVTSDSSGQALDILINKISTNHTFFYRENTHFEYLKTKVLPDIRASLIQKGHKDLRIWCAGCSTGEEAYTLAILLLDFFGSEISSWDVGILATDISKEVLDKASAGIYTDENISNLPQYLKQQFFTLHSKEHWIVKNRVKKLILYRRFNLIREEYPFKGKFNIIFCRNVMIYFDVNTRNKLVNQFYRFTEDEGFLFIGHSESLGRNTCPYQYIKPAVYRKELTN